MEPEGLIVPLHYPGLNVQEISETSALVGDSRPPAGKRCRRWGRRAYALTVFVILAAIFVFFIFPALQPYDPHPSPSSRIPPGTPAAPNVTRQGHDNISLTWTKPAPGSAQISSYTLQQRLGGDEYATVFVGLVLEYTAAGLNGGSSYCFRISANSSAGEGNYSTPTCSSTLQPIPPSAPEVVTPLDTSEESLTVGWQPSENNGAGIDAYVAEAIHITPVDPHPPPSPPASVDLDSPAPIVNCTAPRGHFNCSFAGLRSGDNYTVHVRAHNRVGYGAWSSATMLHADRANPKAPDAPDSPSLISATADTLSLSWSRLRYDQDGGAQPLGYDMGLASANSSEFTLIARNMLRPTPVRVASLNASHFYCFRLRARNRVGVGEWSVANPASCFSTLSAGAPAMPKLPSSPLEVNASTIHLAWQAPPDGGSPITAYELQRDDYFTHKPLATVYTGVAPRFTASTHLLPATLYSFRLRATNSIGTGPWSKVVKYQTAFAGACGNPSDVQAFVSTLATVQHTIQNCIIGCVAKGVDCARQCVHEKEGMSLPCATCWSSMGFCTVHNCEAPCLAPHSKPCLTCANKYCFPQAVECTGIPYYFFPGKL